MPRIPRPERVRFCFSCALALGLLALAVGADEKTDPAAPVASPTAPAAAHATEQAQPKPAWLRNTIRWSTASEVDNFGYDVYRGLEEKGTFAKVNAKPILGHGTTDEPSSYEFIDDTIEPGTAYWYYVESISISGQREIFTPTFQAKPKFPPPPQP